MSTPAQNDRLARRAHSEPAPPARITDEFFPDAAEWPATLSRREFLQLAGASLALAGLSGCARRGAENIVPRVASSPDRASAAGETLSFATAMPCEGYARGVLVTSHDGRPTKIEGNPDHPESRGATDAITQAAILSLYDPDRSTAPLRLGLPSNWSAFETEWLALRGELLGRRGAGLALLTEPTTSPTLLREIRRVLDAMPEARWFQHTPLARYDYDGAQPDFDFGRANVTLSIQSDCFFRHPAALRYARAFANRRRVEGGKVNPPLFYALECTPSVTGSLADFRLPASPTRINAILDAIATTLDRPEDTSVVSALSPAEKIFVHGFVADVRANSGRVAGIAGPESDPTMQQWTHAFNARHGREVTRALRPVRSDSDPRAAGDLAALAAAIDRDELRALFVLEANPVYTAPSDLGFAEKLRRVEFAVHLGEYRDETAASCRWHLPAPHFLETWSDLCSYDGTTTIQQPLIEPLHASRAAAEILRFVGSGLVLSAYDLVRETWRGALGDGDFEAKWHRSLDRGVVENSMADVFRAAPVASPQFPKLAKSGATPEALSLSFQPDPHILDGRWANNAWLQELPKPFSHLVWDNAALVSPQLAAERGLVNGDVVTCEIDGARLEAPVWITPGQAASVVTLSLGYGRTQAGPVGNNRGHDAYRLRTSAALWHREGLTLRKLSRRDALVSTHDHFSLEGRDLVHVILPAAANVALESRAPAPSLFPDWPKDRYAWGMSIDLSTCLGCNACVVACQAENNIPVVGKEQVARGREMHWIRIDRYYDGDPANPRFLHQPVPCMQCENAPCEVVCPVAATVHSSEGLNDMVYNRCIGTRYCSNNCPYKVRRFNFLDYRAPAGSTVYLQSNPSVSVRARGVMEKCTYCVQRIDAARIAADRENRAIGDGEIRTACQQVCPAEAIVFGNINDSASRVSRRKAEPTNYALLAELNTRPRTTYLAKVVHASAAHPAPAAT